LERLLAAMAAAPFDVLVATGLLKAVEDLVVRAYLEAHPGASRPDAYHWLRYEDPDPVLRLADGVRRLRQEGARLDSNAVDKACAKASAKGVLN
jgi:hypothetical protein